MTIGVRTNLATVRWFGPDVVREHPQKRAFTIRSVTRFFFGPTGIAPFRFCSMSFLESIVSKAVSAFIASDNHII